MNNLDDLKKFIDLDLFHILKKINAEGSATSAPSHISEQQCKNAVNYPLSAGGKRVRPILAHLFSACTAEQFQISAQLSFAHSRPTALALEFIHTYSLVHDDLPCMDNDSMRRGLPTTHIVYGDAKALLVGDGLLTTAFEILTSQNNTLLPFPNLNSPLSSCELVSILSSSSGISGMVLGQWLDLSFTNTNHTSSWSDLEKIHRHKTGMLLAAACEMGVVCGIDSLIASNSCNLHENLPKNKIQKLAREIGFSAGLAFQITDDILDATQPKEILGKTSGKDSLQNKLTAVELLGMEGAKEKAHQCTLMALECFSEMIGLLKQSGIENLKNSKPETSFTHWQNITFTYLKNLLNRPY